MDANVASLLAAYNQVRMEETCNEANEFLKRVYADPTSIMVHLVLLQQCDDATVSYLAFGGIIKTIEYVREIPGEICARFETFLVDRLRSCQTLAQGHRICDVIQTLVMHVNKMGNEGAFGEIFACGKQMLEANVPQDVSFHLWYVIFPRYIQNEKMINVDMIRSFVAWACRGLANESENTRVNACRLINAITGSVDECAIGDLWTGIGESVTQLAAQLFTKSTEVTIEIRELVSFIADVFREEEKPALMEALMPVVAIAASVIGREDVCLDVRLMAQQVLCLAAREVAEGESVETVAGMIAASLSLCEEVCKRGPEERMWQCPEGFYIETMEMCIAVFLGVLPSVLQSECPFRRLVGLLIVKSMVENMAEAITPDMVMMALRSADVDNELMVTYMCEVIDAFIERPVIVTASFGPIWQFLAKWGRFPIVFRTLEAVVKCAQVSPSELSPVLGHLLGMLNGADSRTVLEVLYAIGTCIEQPGFPTDGLFEALSPVIGTAMTSCQDLAPAVFICSGNLAKVTPQRMVVELPRLFAYACACMTPGSYLAFRYAARMIMQLTECLPTSVAPFLERVVPIFTDAVSQKIPESDEMRIEHNRTMFLDMQKSCTKCLCVIAREVAAYSAISASLWNICTSFSWDAMVENLGVVVEGVPMFIERGCCMDRFVDMLLGRLRTETRIDRIKTILETISYFVDANTAAFSAENLPRIVQDLLPAFEGTYDGFLVPCGEGLVIPLALKIAMLSVVASLVDQVKGGIVPHLDMLLQLLDCMLSEDVRCETTMKAHIALVFSKICLYCPTNEELVARTCEFTMETWESACSFDSQCLLGCTMLNLFSIAKERLTSSSMHFIELTVRITAALPDHEYTSRSTFLCLWGLLTMSYNVEVDNTTVKKAVDGSVFTRNTDILPYQAAYLVFVHNKDPTIAASSLPRVAGMILSSRPSFLSRINATVLQFFTEVARRVTEEQWMEVLGGNESLRIRITKNLAMISPG